MADDAVKRMDIKEFREGGFLQEANRHFFHPLGLALEVAVDDCHHPGVEAGSFPADRCELCDEDGKVESLGGVWDYREDPEGIVFDNGYGLDREKASKVTREFVRHLKVRNQMFEVEDGVQPLPPAEPELEGEK